MITAVDTNVLFDLFRTDALHHAQSRGWLRRAYDRGAIVVCDVVYAELVPFFADRAALDAALREIGASLASLDAASAYEAGRRWQRYRAAGGPRQRIMPDFLIGAHAITVADTFLTRDRGFYATYFPELKGAETL